MFENLRCYGTFQAHSKVKITIAFEMRNNVFTPSRKPQRFCNIFVDRLLSSTVACFQPLGMEDFSIPSKNVDSSVASNIFNARLNYAGTNQFVGGVF